MSLINKTLSILLYFSPLLADSSVENAKTKALSSNIHTPGEFLTTDQGVRINDNENSLRAGSRGPALLEDFILREKITHFDHERIPERVVHARGAGAHGYFQVYKPMAEYTKAAFLQDPGVKTPVFVRFSTVAGFRGSADTVRDVRGFATKFYTTEGNFDLVGNNMPVFFIQDAIKFPDLIHAAKPEPMAEIPQASTAHDNFWDFISLTPESMHMIMWVISDRALPRSYSTMEGFGVHTFKFVNAEGKVHFVKFHWKPVNGLSSITFEEAQIIGGKDPDFNRRDLWDLIEEGHFPEYEFGVQLLAEDELDKVKFDILDPTKLWPEEAVPVMKIGKLVLNRNPDNFFAETEQIAFHPGNLVQGIDFTDDPLLQGRLFSYLDTQLIRLGGPNFHEIPINKPIADVTNNQRDGFQRHTINRGNVNYEPSSLCKGGCPMQASWAQGGFITYPQKVNGEKIRKRPESFSDHYSQAALFWNSMSPTEKQHIVSAFHFELGKVKHNHIKEKMVEHLNHINNDLAVAVAAGIGVAAPKKGNTYSEKEKSHALSMENHKPTSIQGKKIALLIAEGASDEEIESLQKAFKQDGATLEVISSNFREKSKVNKTLNITDAALYDAIIVINTKGDDLERNRKAVKFINEAYETYKPIAIIGNDQKLLAIANAKVNPEDGVFVVNKLDVGSFVKGFKPALLKQRYWERDIK